MQLQRCIISLSPNESPHTTLSRFNDAENIETTTTTIGAGAPRSRTRRVRQPSTDQLPVAAPLASSAKTSRGRAEQRAMRRETEASCAAPATAAHCVGIAASTSVHALPFQTRRTQPNPCTSQQSRSQPPTVVPPNYTSRNSFSFDKDSRV